MPLSDTGEGLKEVIRYRESVAIVEDIGRFLLPSVKRSHLPNACSDFIYTLTRTVKVFGQGDLFAGGFSGNALEIQNQRMFWFVNNYFGMLIPPPKNNLTVSIVSF